MKKYGCLKDLTSLALILTITISTLSTPVSSASTNELVKYKPINQHWMTILGTKICMNNFNTSFKSLFLGDTAYISVNKTVTLKFESQCFKKPHSITFYSKSWESILVLESTNDGLLMKSVYRREYSEKDGRVIKSEKEIEYFDKAFIEMNLEIREYGDCSNYININILWEEPNNGWFMEKCDLDSFFEEKYVDLCDIYSEKYKKHSSIIQFIKNSFISNEKIVIKPMSDSVIVKTKYCDEQVHSTQFNSDDFINNLILLDEWLIFEYNVKELSSSISISISGLTVDHWNYKGLECDEEPEFTFIGVKEIKRLCSNYVDDLIKDSVYNINSYGKEYMVNQPVYTTEYTTNRVINFPYLIIIIMIMLGKAICGYGVYKRRQARLISFQTSRIVGSNVITIVSSNRQSGSQSHSQNQPSEDLPPAYNDLQNTDGNPPGYEDACKNKSVSPPGYEDACRDNRSFEVDIENSTSSSEPESMVVNQVSTNNPAATQC